MIRHALIRESRLTLSLAWPIIGAQLLQLSMVFVDNIMVGRLGAKPLAALAVASSLFSLVFVFGIGILSGLSPLISQAHGAQDQRRIATTIQHGLGLSLLIAILAVSVFYLSGPLFTLLQQPPELIPTAKKYLQIIAFGIPAAYGTIALRQLTEGISRTRPSFVIAAIGTIVNIVADYALVLGKFGAPALGVIGAAWATVVVLWLMFGAMLVYVNFWPSIREQKLLTTPFSFSPAVVGEILRIGLPLGAMLLFEAGFFITATWMMGAIGAIELASHQIALNAASITYMIPLGLSIALGVRIGQSAGAQNWEAVRTTGTTGLILAMMMTSITALLFLFFPRTIIAIYTSDPQIGSLAIALLTIAGIFQVFDGLQSVGLGTLRGLKDTKMPLLFVIMAFWAIGFPISYFSTFVFKVGAQGIWWGMLTALVLTAFLHYWRFYRLLSHKLPR